MTSQTSVADRFATWILGLPQGWRLVLGALASAVPFYFAAFLSHSVAAAAQLGRPVSLAIHAVVFIVLLALVILGARYFAHVYDQLATEHQSRIAMRLHAYAYLDRLVIQDVRSIAGASLAAENFAARFGASESTLQELVQAAYNALEAAYGKSARTEDRTDFEVTFMTKSYKDGHITIPACANRDGRTPRSMILRQNRTDIYDNTVTATIYREPRPSIHIIEDTASPQVHYEELYPGQINRICSSIVYPVLSNTNELLGTLVLHCDKPRFFRQVDEKFWTDVLEVFSKRLALAKLKLDALIGLSSPVSIGSFLPPF